MTPTTQGVAHRLAAYQFKPDPAKAARNRRILNLRAIGWQPREIAAHLGLSRNVVIGVCNKRGLCCKGFNPTRKLTDEKVIALRERYRPYSRTDGGKVIAYEERMHPEYVRQVLRGKLRAA